MGLISMGAREPVVVIYGFMFGRRVAKMGLPIVVDFSI